MICLLSIFMTFNLIESDSVLWRSRVPVPPFKFLAQDKHLTSEAKLWLSGRRTLLPKSFRDLMAANSI